MLRVLIVDDERITRDTLRSFVPWRSLGIDEVDTANNGVDALEKIDRHRPNLIVCDVRMPRMNGLEMAKIVRARDPACGIIFLSGYSDKEYLKTAIKLQATDYIEKPINVGEVTAAVERNVKAMRERTKSCGDAARARRVLSDLEPVLRQSFAVCLLQPGVCLDTLRRKYHRRLCDAFLLGPVRAAIVEAADDTPERDENWHLAINNTVRSLNEDAAFARGLAAWPARGNRIGIIAGGEITCDSALFASSIRHAAATLARAWRNPVGPYVGIGGPVASAAELAASCAQAEHALASRFYRPDEQFLEYQPPRDAPWHLDDAALADFSDALRERGLERATSVLQRIDQQAQGAQNSDIQNIRETYGSLATLALELAPGWDPSETRAERDLIARHVQTTSTLRALRALVESYLHKCLAPGSLQVATSRRLARVQEFIREHHSDCDLTIETIAAAAGYSESYLCTFYKHACGITVKDFVTMLRVEKAKELLRDTDDKLQAVALDVGFRDANYFSTVFKRQTGITPREYRERSQR